MANTTVKYFHSAMNGAPVLSGTSGALIAVLDACLVSGFGAGVADSVVITSNVAVVTLAAGHSQEIGSVAFISGATVTGGSINGEQKVIAATATTFSFATTSISNQTATGTISQKLAPAGWAKPFSATNVAAYKSSDPTSTGFSLRVDDTGTTACRVIGYEVMSDIATGTGPFPTPVQRPGGCFWAKSVSADSTPSGWIVATDAKTVYVARRFHPGYPNAYELTMFGDINSTKGGDAYSCVLNGFTASTAGPPPNSVDNLWCSTGSVASEFYVARGYTGLGGSAQLRKSIPQLGTTTLSFNSGQGSTPYPNTCDGGVYLAPVNIAEHSTLAFRGTLPGYYGCAQNIADGIYASRDSVIGIDGLPGRTIKVLTGAYNGLGASFFDITGPWR